MSGREAVFLDTSGWIASLDAVDRWHARAVGQYRRLGEQDRSFVTTDWVIAETGNGLSRVKTRRLFPDAVQKFFSSPNCRMVLVVDVLFQEALDLYARSDDKTRGLVDCASFVVMRRENIVDAFTTDHHFRQAGFRPLPTASPR